MAQHRFGDGPYTIVLTCIDERLVASSQYVSVDGGIEAVIIPTNLLYALEPPTIIERDHVRS